MTLRCRASLSLLAVVALGCNNGSPPPETTGAGGGSGTTSSSGSGGGGGAGAAPSAFGGVTVLQQQIAGSWSGVFSVTFYEAEGTPADCTPMQVGDCTIDDCTYETPSGTTPVTNRSAGTVSVEGTLVPLSLMPGAAATYTPATVVEQLWTAGETIHFTATGDAVPAFSGSVIGVGLVALDAPVIGGSPLAIDRSADLTASWTGESAGTATVQLTRVEKAGGTSHSVAVTCRYPAAAQSGTVPAAALQAIPAGDGSIAFFNRDDDIVDAGDFRITLSSITSNVGGSATFQ